MKYETLRRLTENKRSECDHFINSLGGKQSFIQTILDRCADLSDKIKRKVSEIEQSKKTISLYTKRIVELEAEVEEMDTSEFDNEKRKLGTLTEGDGVTDSGQRPVRCGIQTSEG